MPNRHRLYFSVLIASLLATACGGGLGQPFKFDDTGVSAYAFRDEGTLAVGQEFRLAVVGGTRHRHRSLLAEPTRTIAEAARITCGADCDGVLVTGHSVPAPLRNRDDIKLLQALVGAYAWGVPQWHTLHDAIADDDGVPAQLAQWRHSHQTRGHAHFWRHRLGRVLLLGIDTSRAFPDRLRKMMLTHEAPRPTVIATGYRASKANRSVTHAALVIGGDGLHTGFDAATGTLMVAPDDGFAIVSSKAGGIRVDVFEAKANTGVSRIHSATRAKGSQMWTIQ